MAQYHYKAEKLKPLVEAAKFTPEQLTIVHRMMRGCTMLRQGKVITSFFELMLPEDMQIAYGAEKQGKYGTFRPIYVIKKGEQLNEQTQPQEEGDNDD